MDKWNELVAEVMRERKVTRSQAIRICVREHPDVHKAMLDEANSHRPTTRR